MHILWDEERVRVEEWVGGRMGGRVDGWICNRQ